MALTVTLGRNALVALGAGPSDIVTLYNLGRRFGNWLTATDDDKKLLQLLKCDEFELLKRRGVIDLDAFKARWSQTITILVNGRPKQNSSTDVKEALEEVTRFTACMMTIVAVLDAFTHAAGVKAIMRALLNALFAASFDGELTLSVELETRINAWRSAACVRGIHLRVQEIQKELLHDGLIQGGRVPEAELYEIVMFLQWLLAGATDEMTSPSSDVAGIATCLSRIAFDILWTAWPGQARPIAPCTLVYDNTKSVRPLAEFPNFSMEDLTPWRSPKTAVPVDSPEETISSFPVSPGDGNHFRSAWKSGQKCGDLIEFQLRRPTQTDINDGNDLKYDILDHGTPCGRVNTDIFALVEMQAFSANQETCDALVALLHNVSNEDIVWAVKQYRDQPNWNYTFELRDGKTTVKRTGPEAKSGPELRSLHIQDVRMKDDQRIFPFTLLQAFFLGYYYSIVFGLVDTTKLQHRVVDGAFSYRSPTFFRTMQSFVKSDLPRHQVSLPVVGTMSRQRLLEMLPARVDFTRRDQWLIGVIESRALLASSILSPTVTPAAISKLTLLDTDVSSIPKNKHGAVISGTERKGLWNTTAALQAPPVRVQDIGTNEDFTMHIEADWDVNTELTLICVRYKGRRIGTYHPLVAEKRFLLAYVDPVASPKPPYLEQARPCTVQHLAENRIDLNSNYPVLIQAKGNPCIRYTILALTCESYCKVASNCVQTAAEQLCEIHSPSGVKHFVVGSE